MAASHPTVGDAYPDAYRPGAAPVPDDDLHGLTDADRRRSVRRAWLLFAITVVTTTLAGAQLEGVAWWASAFGWTAGLPFSAVLMAILLAHELGHYIASREYGVDTSPPYFIPFPPFLNPIGTLGAVIRMREHIDDRRALFDIAVAGPWAGFFLSIPAIYAGLLMSEVKPLPDPIPVGLGLGDNLIFRAMTALVHEVPEGHELYLDSIAFAGWIGLFVTALNLLPIGQLDGGHASYAVLGRRHAVVARLMFAALLLLGIFSGWEGWLIWAALLFFLIRLDHPPTSDGHIPLGRARLAVGALTLALFVGSFTPKPFEVVGLESLEDAAPVEQPIPDA